MASINDTVVQATVQAPPIVGQLQAVFVNLGDAPLLDALTGPTRRGRGIPLGNTGSR